MPMPGPAGDDDWLSKDDPPPRKPEPKPEPKWRDDYDGEDFYDSSI